MGFDMLFLQMLNYTTMRLRYCKTVYIRGSVNKTKHPKGHNASHMASTAMHGTKQVPYNNEITLCLPPGYKSDLLGK